MEYEEGLDYSKGSSENLGQAVYERTDIEYSAFISEMETHDASYVLDHAYEIVIMNDLHMIFEDRDFLVSELQEFAEIEMPLATIYESWLKKDGGHMEQLRDTVEDFANDRLRQRAERLYANPAAPRYEKPYNEASELDEIHFYSASNKRDLECLHHFEKGVSNAHEARQLKAFTQEWAEAFGRDRCKFVLGYTVQNADWDKRYADEAKQDSQQYNYQKNGRHNPFGAYATNTHPCLVDCSYRILMDMEHGKLKHEKER